MSFLVDLLARSRGEVPVVAPALPHPFAMDERVLGEEEPEWAGEIEEVRTAPPRRGTHAAPETAPPAHAPDVVQPAADEERRPPPPAPPPAGSGEKPQPRPVSAEEPRATAPVVSPAARHASTATTSGTPSSEAAAKRPVSSPDPGLPVGAEPPAPPPVVPAPPSSPPASSAPPAPEPPPPSPTPAPPPAEKTIVRETVRVEREHHTEKVIETRVAREPPARRAHADAATPRPSRPRPAGREPVQPAAPPPLPAVPRPRPSPPPVHVSIGRVVVRPERESESVERRPAPPAAHSSPDDLRHYLERRSRETS